MPTGKTHTHNRSHRTPRSHCTLTPRTDRTWLGGGRAITAPRQPPRNLFPDTRPFEGRALFVLALYRWSGESWSACRVNGVIPSTTRTCRILNPGAGKKFPKNGFCPKNGETNDHRIHGLCIIFRCAAVGSR